MEVIMHMAKAFWLLGSGQIWELMEKFKKAGRVIGERWDRLSPLATLGVLALTVPLVLVFSVYGVTSGLNAIRYTELAHGRVVSGYENYNGGYTLHLDNGRQYDVSRWDQTVGGLPQVGKEATLYEYWGDGNVRGYTLADARRAFSLTPAPTPKLGSEGGQHIKKYEHTHVGKIESLGKDEFGRTVIKFTDSDTHMAAAIVEGELVVGESAGIFRCDDLNNNSILVARAIGPEPESQQSVQVVQPVRPQVVQQIVVRQQ